MPVRLTSWNLQGRARPDLDAVADVLRERDPDVVVLQEVQRRQAHGLADRFGWSATWHWKHWPVVIPAEGLAVLAPEPPATATVEILAQPWAFWSSDRRIALSAAVRIGGSPLQVIATHLGAGVGNAERARQARLVVDLVGATGAPVVVAGDLNTSPDSAVIEVFRTAGFRDAWTEVHDEADRGFTNWDAGSRHEPPVRRLDYVLVPEVLRVVDADVPRFGDPDFDRYGPLSDHLPVTVTLERG